MSYIKKSLPKVASLGLVGMMLVSAMPGNQASASEQVTPNTATQEVAQQALQGYLATKGQATKLATAEQLQQPFAPELYHVRTQFTAEGQKAWDYALKQLLEFDPAKGYGNKLTTLNDGNGTFTVDFKEAGIDITKADIPKLREQLTAGDPRMFVIGNWGGEPTVDKDGKVKSITFTIKSKYMQDGAYHKALQDIEQVVSGILAPVNDQMTDAQKLNAFYMNYQANTNYAKGPSLQDIDGAFLDKKVVCGGYAKAFQYLAMRSGVKTMFITGHTNVGHAWNYTELDGKWYFVDSTWDDNLSSKSFFLRGTSTLKTHKPNEFYTKMATLNEADYDRSDILWVLPDQYEEASEQTVNKIVGAIRTAVNKWNMSIPYIRTIKTSLPAGNIGSGHILEALFISDLKKELNSLNIDGKVSITIDNNGKYNNASDIINKALTIKYQPVSDSPEYQFVGGKFSAVQQEVVEPEVVEKTGEQIARETYDMVSKSLEAILTKYQAELSQVDDIMVISPKELDYVGKTEVEQKIADELIAELEDKTLGRVAVMISGKAEYKTPQDFIANGVLVGYQGVDGKYYQFTKGDQMSVYGE